MKEHSRCNRQRTTTTTTTAAAATATVTNNNSKIIPLFQEDNIYGTSASLTYGLQLQMYI